MPADSAQPLVLDFSSRRGSETAAVALDRGRELQVLLSEIPSAGYRWEAIEVPAVLGQEPDGDPSGFDPDDQLVGGPVTACLRFVARQAGEGQIVLVYRRSWETGVEPLYTNRIVVRVS